jgi:transcriptional regulator with XRE-family HTH domain
MKSVRERIRSAMGRAGVTQGQLAEACGVSGPAVNQWLTGKTKKIDPSYLVDVAACTNASLNWLMTGKGEQGRRTKDPLSSAEQKLLKDYRKLSARMRTQVSRLVESIAET